MYKCDRCLHVYDESPFYVKESTQTKYCKACVRQLAYEEQEKEYYNKIFMLIRKVFHLDSPTPKQFAEIKRSHEKDNLSYKEIYETINYSFNVIHERPYKDSLYVISKYHEAAALYYEAQEQRSKENDDIINAISTDEHAAVTPVQVRPVYIPPQRHVMG